MHPAFRGTAVLILLAAPSPTAEAQTPPAEGVGDFSWDAIWESAGRLAEDGYVVEFGIPFRSLRFPARPGEQTWGLILERSWPRSARHRIDSAPRDQSDACTFCQANKVTGLLQARLLYHLNVRTFVRAIVQWQHVDRDPTRYAVPVPAVSRSVLTQFLFSYKLDPQTVAFLGYSDTSLGTDAVDLTRQSRTFFVKLGYALRP